MKLDFSFALFPFLPLPRKKTWAWTLASLFQILNLMCLVHSTYCIKFMFLQFSLRPIAKQKEKGMLEKHNTRGEEIKNAITLENGVHFWNSTLDFLVSKAPLISVNTSLSPHFNACFRYPIKFIIWISHRFWCIATRLTLWYFYICMVKIQRDFFEVRK